MKRKSASDQPWYIAKCRACREMKHLVEFRVRTGRPGELLRCRSCDQAIREERYPSLQRIPYQ
jgi:hypothetical protein